MNDVWGAVGHISETDFKNSQIASSKEDQWNISLFLPQGMFKITICTLELPGFPLLNKNQKNKQKKTTPKKTQNKQTKRSKHQKI